MNLTNEPLRGDAAWKAHKKLTSERNEATYARGRKERAAQDARMWDVKHAQERKEASRLPKQPTRP